MRREATEEDMSPMPATEPTKIRNIAVAGHRGVGKTSLVEALLYEAGKTNRLGSVEQGTTVSDWDERSEHELTGIVDLLHMCAYMDPSGGREGGPQAIPDSMADVVAEHREKLLDAVVETDEDLMARYLEGEELDAGAVAEALKQAVTRDELYPVACGVAAKNLGTTALLDLLVEGVPSPAKKGTTIEFGDAKQAVLIFMTIADPFTSV